MTHQQQRLHVTFHPIQQSAHLLFVVITNDQGVRLSHPNRDELGKHVSTDPSEALAGHEVVKAWS